MEENINFNNIFDITNDNTQLTNDELLSNKKKIIT